MQAEPDNDVRVLHEPINVKPSPSSSLTEERGGTEGLKSKATTIKIGEPDFSAVDVRTQSPEVRAARLAELRQALHKIRDNPSGRAEARRNALLYKLNILCK